MGNEPVPNYGIADDFPKLWKLAQAYDFAARLGAVGGTLEQEADRVLRELWDARRSVADTGPVSVTPPDQAEDA